MADVLSCDKTAFFCFVLRPVCFIVEMRARNLPINYVSFFFRWKIEIVSCSGAVRVCC